MRALENLSISIFIKVLPISVSRILATQRTTTMNTGGRDVDAKKITPSQISPWRGQGDKIWMINRETFSTPLLLFSLMCYRNPFIDMVWYLEYQVKVRTSGAQESIRTNYWSKSYGILMGRWPTSSIKILQQ